MKVDADAFTVRIEFDFEEAIGLYKMALGMNHPTDGWEHDEDVQQVSAALLVRLREVVGP